MACIAQRFERGAANRTNGLCQKDAFGYHILRTIRKSPATRKQRQKTFATQGPNRYAMEDA
jgi:hypothetical protein